jgi:pimeloyl-ACP methyl ester carboxylesterase
MLEDLLLAWGPWGFAPQDVPAEVHLWHGALDRTVPVHHARALAAALPRHRLEVAEDEGHFFFRRRVAEILAALLGARRAGPPRPAPMSSGAGGRPMSHDG